MNVPNSKCNFPSELFLVKLHSYDFVGEPLMEQTVDLGTSGQFQYIYSSGATAFNCSFKILLKLLNTPKMYRSMYATLVETE